MRAKAMRCFSPARERLIPGRIFVQLTGKVFQTNYYERCACASARAALGALPQHLVIVVRAPSDDEWGECHWRLCALPSVTAIFPITAAASKASASPGI